MINPFKNVGGYKTALAYAALFSGMFFMNLTMSRFEPFSLALFAAALVWGAAPLAAAALYLLAGGIGLLGGGIPFAAVAGQAVFLGGVFFIYRKTGKSAGKEIALYLLAAALLFFWLYGKYVYGDYAKAAIVAASIYALCFIMIGAMRCVLLRAGKRRLSSEDLLFCAAAAAALGIGILGGVGEEIYESAALLLILLCAALLDKGNSALCALVLAVPVCIRASAAAAEPVLTQGALYVFYAAVCVVFLRIGKLPAALALFFTNVTARYFTEFFSATDLAAPFTESAFYLAMLIPFVPCALFAALPQTFLKRLSDVLHRYSEKTLTRAGIDRNRAVIAEKLFDLSAVFREIEFNFSAETENEERESEIRAFMAEALQKEVCEGCERKQNCSAQTKDELRKLIGVGCAKGRVNLIDVPSEIAAHCAEPSALLFSLNKLLTEYRRQSAQEEDRVAGKKLLAAQARAVAEMLKKIAVTECAPVRGGKKAETAVRAALARNGIPCDEALLSEEGELMLTAAENADGKRICKCAAAALGEPYSLSKKREIAPGKFYYLLRRTPKSDAAFGVASRTKDGETQCGDTHSTIRIDERNFLFALSDGMGSGENARSVSDRALSLIESFCRAGLSGESTLETVNALLSFRKDERFACVDIASIDLDSGNANVVKIGSPLSFLLTEKGAEILESDSLPLGILDGVRPTVYARTLADGDMLVFVSDGITAAFGSSADMAEFLLARRTSNPQALAEDFLQGALERTGGTAPDDMTVIALRLFSRSE